MKRNILILFSLSFFFGAFAQNTGRTGINTTSPTADLDINGTLRIRSAGTYNNTVPGATTNYSMMVSDDQGNKRELQGKGL